MPVFGKGRTQRKGPTIRKDHNEIARKLKKERTVRETKKGIIWEFSHGSLSDVIKHLNYPIQEHIEHLLKRRKNPVIVDWGCGAGTAITTLAQQFPKARCYGFGDQRHPEWKTNEHAKLIWAPAEDFRRYFKDNSIDFMYSHLGLTHLHNPVYVIGLLKKLRTGGTLVTGLVETSIFKGHVPEHMGRQIRKNGKTTVLLTLGDIRIRVHEISPNNFEIRRIN
ncbi:MAG: class I SAM-dependent methyltransferase [Candidatus Diapherotrites archaeon]|nr:class I SAM-dependent methyltransferase [Candidatus Diapherotrites archaeon]